MHAGTYTPIAVVGLGGSLGATVLRRVWAGALAGVLQSAFWPRAPKAFATSIYIALGWTILPYVTQVLPRRKGIGTLSACRYQAGGRHCMFIAAWQRLIVVI